MRNINQAVLALVALFGVGCVGQIYHMRPGDVSPQIRCEYKDAEGNAIDDPTRAASDACYLGPAMIYETKYGDDGPGNGNDTRRYFIQRTLSSGKFLEEEIDTSKWKRMMPGHKVIAGIGYGNCKPLEECTEEADRIKSDLFKLGY